MKLLICYFFTFQSFAQDICAHWNFRSITNIKDNTNLPVNDNDYMSIMSDGTFYYQLSVKNNLTAKGTWRLYDSELYYNYTEPKDTIRCYGIDLNGDELRLVENDFSFRFTRNEQANKSCE